MILPTKHLPLERSLIAGAAALLAELTEPETVSALWERVRDQVAFASFDRYVLALDLLATLGLLRYESGRLIRHAA